MDVANTQSVAADITRVYAQPGFGIPLDVVNGLVRCVHPGIDNHVSFGTVLAVDYDALLMQSYMDVEDLEGRVLNAITEYGCDLTILGNYSNAAPGIEPVTSGHWDDVAYDSLTDTTTFTDFSGTFPAAAIDWWLQPDAARSTYLEIVSISASQIVVAGNAEGLAHGLIPQPGPPPLDPILGTFYTIIWPVGVDPATGTLAHADPCEPISRLLFAGYYYMPPVAGTMIQPPAGGTGPHGAQPGNNHHGDYYCWNRIYDPNIGRWTSPDPAMSPWTNLQNYVDGNPVARTDPSGLSGGYGETPAWDAFGPRPGSDVMIDYWFTAMEECAKKGDVEGFRMATAMAKREQQIKLKRERRELEREPDPSTEAIDAFLDKLAEEYREARRAFAKKLKEDMAKMEEFRERYGPNEQAARRAVAASVTSCILEKPAGVSKKWCNEQYPDDASYSGALARCFCTCAGESPWENSVRSCLACEYRRDPSDFAGAHLRCYRAASILHGEHTTGQAYGGAAPDNIADVPARLMTDMIGCWCQCNKYLTGLENLPHAWPGPEGN